MRALPRAIVASLGATAAVVLIAAPGLAHECVNASRNGAAGAQLVLNDAGDIVYISKGLQSRIDNGLVDFETGEGFHGLIGFDVDNDGVGDLATWIVGKDGEVPLQAQYNGPVCKGVTNIDLYFTECMPA
jgi:hypothetical protein